VIVAASLVAYATVVALLGQFALVRLTRSGSAPRLGILAWCVAAGSAVTCWAFGAMAIADPDPLHGLAHFITAGVTAVHEGTGVHNVTAVRGSRGFRFAAVAVAVAILYRAGFCLAWDAWTARRRRLRHAQALSLVGRPLARRDALVIEHGAPLVYCIPGRSRTIVVTRGALRTLSAAQLDAVLEHERAHLAARHHLVLTSIRALARAFPGVPVLARASAEVSRLVEMSADDTAARRHGRAAVAGALRSLSFAPAPTETVAAASTSAEERIKRLCSPAPPPSGASGPLIAAVAVLATGPLASVVVPILVAASSAG